MAVRIPRAVSQVARASVAKALRRRLIRPRAQDRVASARSGVPSSRRRGRKSEASRRRSDRLSSGQRAPSMRTRIVAMATPSIEKRVAELRQQIEKANYEYHVL